LFTVNVSALGVTDNMQVFDNQTSTPAAAGFADESVCCAGSVLDTFSTAFASYNITTPIGPISGTSFTWPRPHLQHDAWWLEYYERGELYFRSQYSCSRTHRLNPGWHGSIPYLLSTEREAKDPLKQAA